MVNEQGMPVQLICHTKPHNSNSNIDGASWYFGVLAWQLVHLLILLCTFQWCALFLCLAKLYRSCPVRDKGLLVHMYDASTSIKHKDIHVHRHSVSQFPSPLGVTEWNWAYISLSTDKKYFHACVVSTHTYESAQFTHVFCAYACIIHAVKQPLTQ